MNNDVSVFVLRALTLSGFWFFYFCGFVIIVRSVALLITHFHRPKAVPVASTPQSQGEY